MTLAKPRGPLTSGFDLLGDDTVLATMEGSFWREGGHVRVGDDTWELRRQGWSTFRLVRYGVDEAVARAQGFFRGSYEIDHAGRTYRLARQSAWRRTYTVLDGGVEVGSIDPTSAWSNAAQVRLPDTMPLQLQVFIVGVVAIQWRRQQASSASAAT
jgi:hypothetical protein